MSDDQDDSFYDRADAHIHLSNSQRDDVSSGKVSASMMYATTRFNAWVSACGPESGDELEKQKNEVVDYFVKQYRSMLEENLDDYIRNFDKYMRPNS